MFICSNCVPSTFCEATIVIGWNVKLVILHMLVTTEKLPNQMLSQILFACTVSDDEFSWVHEMPLCQLYICLNDLLISTGVMAVRYLLIVLLLTLRTCSFFICEQRLLSCWWTVMMSVIWIVTLVTCLISLQHWHSASVGIEEQCPQLHLHCKIFNIATS